MKALIIGAGEEALHTIQKAKEAGLTVAAMDGNPKAAGLKEADEAVVVNISEETEAVAAAQRIKPDFLLTVPVGRYLTTTGAVNDTLGLPGIGKAAAENCTDKWQFHRLLEKEGLRSAKCSLLTGRETAGEWEEILGNFPYPAVLKPRYGSGSRGIFVVKHEGEAARVLEELYGEHRPVEAGEAKEHDQDYLLEECIEGEEYGIDGAVIGGKFHLILLRRKENTPFPARQAVAYFSVQPSDAFYGQAEVYLKQVIKVLNLQECLVHGDLLRTRKGPFVIELSARPSGHNLHNLFTPLATGVDMAKEYIAYRMGKSCSFTPAYTKKLMIHYFDLEGDVNYVPSEEEVNRLMQEKGYRLLQWNCRINPGERLEKVSDGHSLMGRGYYILEEGEDGGGKSPLNEGENKDAGFTQAAKAIRALLLGEKRF